MSSLKGFEFTIEENKYIEINMFLML